MPIQPSPILARKKPLAASDKLPPVLRHLAAYGPGFTSLRAVHSPLYAFADSLPQVCEPARVQRRGDRLGVIFRRELRGRG